MNIGSVLHSERPRLCVDVLMQCWVVASDVTVTTSVANGPRLAEDQCCDAA